MSQPKQDSSDPFKNIPAEWLQTCIECQKKLAVLDERTKNLMTLMKILLVSVLGFGAAAIIAIIK